MPEYLAPAVYVEEVDTGSKPIEGVSTSTAGMLGITERSMWHLVKKHRIEVDKIKYLTGGVSSSVAVSVGEVAQRYGGIFVGSNQNSDTLTEQYGRRVQFTVDPALQRYAASILEDNDVPAGAIVVVNARTGRVLALAQHERGADADPDDHGDDDDGEPVEREDQRPGAHKAGEVNRRRHRDRIAAPDHEAEIGDDEGDAERHQHLRQRLSRKLAQQETLDQRAEGRHQQRRRDLSW